MLELTEFLDQSYSAYQAVENAVALLEENGFVRLHENADWQLKPNGSYFVVRAGSSLVAFRTPAEMKDDYYYKIVASHTDSPALKLKSNPVINTEGYVKLNIENYGGGLYYSFFDRPLKIAGRVILRDGGKLVSENYVSDYTVSIPSLAMHMNRSVNEDKPINAQKELLPLISLGEADILKKYHGKDVVSYDLFVACAEKPFYSGVHNEFVSSPRVDNLVSVYASLKALIDAEPAGDSSVDMVCCFDNEEVGSQTRMGAASDFLQSVIRRVSFAFDKTIHELIRAMARSISISLDNAHALHPNYTEKCDLTNRCLLGKGIVIKNHANKAYTTEALSSAIIKTIWEQANVPYQEFFNRSDMRSGWTLGAISSGNVSVLMIDMGIPQLAMHSTVECFAVSDYQNAIEGLSAFFKAKIALDGENAEILD